MKRAKFLIPAIALVVSSAFALNKTTPNVEPNEDKVATTYFVFTGTATSQYTDSTKWQLHSTPPTTSCEGLAMACIVESSTVSSRTQLVSQIQTNSGTISGFATITDRKN